MNVNSGAWLSGCYVVDYGYGLGRPALPKGQMYQMVKTQTETHVSTVKAVTTGQGKITQNR